MKIRLGGVPEHFNYPIHWAIEQKLFEKAGIEVIWTDFPGGTGAMAAALRNDEVDVAILLSEGLVADIVKGNKAKIVQLYVASPLVWGIHTGAQNALSEGDSFGDGTYAISRYGSGSHLMAIVDADQRSWSTDLEFKVIQNLTGALDSLTDLSSDVFFWEKFTTKPYVDNGILKRIGECPTPWPCFMIAANESVRENEKLSVFLEIIRKACLHCKNASETISEISEQYKIKDEDVKAWFADMDWAYDQKLQKKDLDQISHYLYTLKIIDCKVQIEELIDSRFVMLS